MPKEIKPLTKTEINKLPDGRFAVGGVRGLYVQKYNGKVSCWILRDRKNGKNQYYPGYLNLEVVKAKATEDKTALWFGVDPSAQKKEEAKQRKEERKKEKLATVRDAFNLWILNEKNLGRWKNSHSAELQFQRTFEKFVLTFIGDRKLYSLKSDEIDQLVLNSFKCGVERGQSVYSSMKKFFAFCLLNQQDFQLKEIPFTNTLSLKIKELKRAKTETKNRAMPAIGDIEEFCKFLLSNKTNVALMAVFAILTASRQEAARKVKWKDLNFESKSWVVSLESDKVKQKDPLKRTIYLSDKVIEFLHYLPKLNSEDYVFPWRILPSGETKCVSDRLFVSFLWHQNSRREKKGLKQFKVKDGRQYSLHATARAGFKTWSRSELNDNYKRFDTECVEHCLLHYTDQYKGAYDRSEQKEHRLMIMNEWAKFLLSDVKLSDYLGTPLW